MENLLAAHDQAALDVALGENGDRELHLIVKIIREIAAQVVVEAGRASGNAHHTEIASNLGCQHAGGFEAVAQAGVAANQFDQVSELALQAVHELG